MHIILVSNRLATAKTLNVSPRMLLGAFAVFVVLSFTTSFFLTWIGVRLNLPFVNDLVESVQRVHQKKSDDYLRDNISTMAVKLGEMQAQIMRLDLLGERISKHSGIALPKNENASGAKGGAGGPLINPGTPYSIDTLSSEVERFSATVEQRVEQLTALESQLMERRLKTTLLPTLSPINADHIGSGFGTRVDPIAGVGALHEGIDFVADVGTPVFASAGGVVRVAEFHPQFGYMVEVDHGNDFVSRYAHLSKFDVRAGQLVRRGQVIAASGNSGRSTGPHLHFEVRSFGVAQNPAHFLKQGDEFASLKRR